MKVGDKVTLKNDTPIHNHLTLEQTGIVPKGTQGVVTERVMQDETLYWSIQLDDIITKPLPYLDSVIENIFTIEEV